MLHFCQVYMVVSLKAKKFQWTARLLTCNYNIWLSNPASTDVWSDFQTLEYLSVFGFRTLLQLTVMEQCDVHWDKVFFQFCVCIKSCVTLHAELLLLRVILGSSLSFPHCKCLQSCMSGKSNILVVPKCTKYEAMGTEGEIKCRANQFCCWWIFTSWF